MNLSAVTAKKIAERTLEYGSVAAFGGSAYNLLEVAWRGFTHPSMTIAGAVCMIGLYCIQNTMSRTRLYIRCLCGCALITAVEFVVGCVVNITMKLNVWDYSRMWGNIHGQICPLYVLLWLLLCVPVLHICSMIKKRIFGSDRA